MTALRVRNPLSPEKLRAAARALGILPPAETVQIEDMQTIDNPEYLNWELGEPLPKGKYEISVLFKGKDNVLLKIDKPTFADDLAETAKERWRNGDTDDLGNEWQETDYVVIRPVGE